MTEDERATIGLAVKARRTYLGVTQQDAARTAGVSDTTWIKVEKGEVVGDITLRKVAWPLRWTPGWVDELLAGQEPTEGHDAPAKDVNGRLDAIEGRLVAIEQVIREAVRGGRQAPG